MNRLSSKSVILFIYTYISCSNTQAGCYSPPDSNKEFPPTLSLSQQVRVSLKSDKLVVEMPGRKKFYLYPNDDDAGSADAIAALSDTRFAVFGQRTSYLGKVMISDGVPVDVVLKKLPFRYGSYCGFWRHNFAPCYINPAKFSPALGAIVMSGYKGSGGTYETFVYSDHEAGSLLRTKNGIPVNYIGDDARGNAIVSVKSRGRFILKDGVLKEC